MEAPQDLSPFLLGPSPVPTVNPTDLKNAWEYQEKMYSLLQENGQAIIDIRPACSPDADLAAVGFRLGMLRLMQNINPFPPGTKPPDSLFNALAMIPMTGMRPGVPQQQIPFDINELLRLVQK